MQDVQRYPCESGECENVEHWIDIRPILVLFVRNGKECCERIRETSAITDPTRCVIEFRREWPALLSRLSGDLNGVLCDEVKIMVSNAYWDYVRAAAQFGAAHDARLSDSVGMILGEFSLDPSSVEAKAAEMLESVRFEVHYGSSRASMRVVVDGICALESPLVEEYAIPVEREDDGFIGYAAAAAILGLSASDTPGTVVSCLQRLARLAEPFASRRL